MHQGVILH